MLIIKEKLKMPSLNNSEWYWVTLDVAIKLEIKNSINGQQSMFISFSFLDIFWFVTIFFWKICYISITLWNLRFAKPSQK